MAKKKTKPYRAKQADLERRARQEGRGRDAERPSAIPAKGWKDILWRVGAEVVEDRVTLIAAGVTFYLLLALFPALAAFVSIYGFVADPQTIAEHISFLGGVLPSGGLDLIRSQLESLAGQETGALSLGFILGLAVALWSANNGVKALFQAMNVAYEEAEKRSFVKLNLMALAFTLGAILIGISFIVSVGIVPAVLAFLNLSGWAEALVRIVRWPVLLILVAAGISLIYRFGPSRVKAQLPWLTWGAGLATIVWLAASIAFSYYLENFANYNATYGTLGAVIGFMMWTWLSVVILIVGAELNAEMEHQTAKDTTVGAPQPIGARGAEVADTLGRSAGGSGSAR
jgi:membrane protein